MSDMYLDSKERGIVRVGSTDSGGKLTMVTTAGVPSLWVNDSANRCVARITGDDLVALTKALLEAQGVVMPVDEAIDGIKQQLATKALCAEAADALDKVCMNAYGPRVYGDLIDRLRAASASEPEA